VGTRDISRRKNERKKKIMNKIIESRVRPIAIKKKKEENNGTT
jgi:hypothetical protein